MSQNSSPAIEFLNVEKRLGPADVIRDISFQLPNNAITTLIGESGSGKTTCLRLMNGLLRPDRGRVLLWGKDFNYDKAIYIRRQMGYSQQGSGLFPHLTVFENISFIARRNGWSRAESLHRSQEVLEAVNISPEEYLHKRPAQLSGGQRQRVGIARALFLKPKLMLMDEPFGALDPMTREEVQDLFVNLQHRYELTVVLVTHDLTEAFKMSDYILLLNQGQVEQFGKPNQLLMSPGTAFVQSFLKSHSPGHVLENIKLYSIMNSGIWLTQEQSASRYSLTRLDSGQTTVVDGMSEVRNFHQAQKQEHIILVTNSGHLVAIESSSTGVRVPAPKLVTIRETENFLVATRALLDQESKLLVVVSGEGKIIGSFSKEALVAL